MKGQRRDLHAVALSGAVHATYGAHGLFEYKLKRSWAIEAGNTSTVFPVDDVYQACLSGTQTSD
jgi:hypothetical protein